MIKKFISFISVLSIIAVVIGYSMNVNANVYETIEGETFVGKTINAVTARSYNDVNDKSLIFDYDFLDTNLTVGQTISGTSDVEVPNYLYEGHNVSSVTEKIQNTFKMKLSGKGTKKNVFTLAVTGNIEYTTKEESKTYYDKYYIQSMSTSVYKKQLIVNYGSNATKTNMAGNLSEEFKNDLVKVATKAMTYEQLFDKYGTHVIMYCYVGSQLELDFVTLTNACEITKEVSTSFGATADINMMKKMAVAKADVSNSHLSSYGCNVKNTKVFFDVHQLGATKFSSFNGSNIENAYMEWSQHSFDNPGIVAYEEDSLVGIWEFIPEKIGNVLISKEEMLNAFINYSDSNETIILPNDEKYEMKTSIIAAPYAKYILENNAMVIHDGGKTNGDGRFSNFRVEYDIYDLFNLGPSIINANYRSLKFTISFEAKDKNDGYRYVYLYTRLESSDIYKAYSTNKFETTRNYSTYKYDCVINLRDYPLEDKIYILFGADGFGADDWYIYNIKCSFTVMMNAR